MLRIYYCFRNITNIVHVSSSICYNPHKPDWDFSIDTLYLSFCLIGNQSEQISVFVIEKLCSAVAKEKVIKDLNRRFEELWSPFFTDAVQKWFATEEGCPLCHLTSKTSL